MGLADRLIGHLDAAMEEYLVATEDGQVLDGGYETREYAAVVASAMNCVVELGWIACDAMGQPVDVSDVEVTVDDQYEALLDMGMAPGEAFDLVRGYC